MTRLLAFLAAMLVVWPAMAAPLVSGPSSPKSAFSVNIVFPVGDTTQSQAIPVSGFCSVRYQQSGGDDASLYAVTTATTAASSGTLIAAFTSSTTTATTFTAGTRWVKAVATDATAGGSVMTIDCAPLTGGGGGSRDADGDGLYEVAYIWDADGDGSTYVTCTAKDTPDAACKVAGEIVYRDWADDINCAMHGCGNGQMEVDGTIYHRDAVVYVNFPCWDAREPAGFNDPEATTEALHDSTADTAWTHCPQTPDFADSGRRFMTVATLGWQGEIIGAGVDPRNPDTTTGYKRDTGSYIVDDRGPSWASGAQANLNSWFGVSNFVRGINFGFDSAANQSAGTAAISGEWSGDFDSIGGGTISGTQVLTDIDGDICVTESGGWPTDLRAGDIVEVHGTSQTATFSSQTVSPRCACGTRRQRPIVTEREPQRSPSVVGSTLARAPSR